MQKINLENTKHLNELTRQLSDIQRRLYFYQEAIKAGSDRDIQLSSGQTLVEALNQAEAALDCIQQDFCYWIPEDVEYTKADWIE